MAKLSVVSAVYRAEKIVSELVSRLEITLLNLEQDYEIILVDDRSPDESWEEIIRLSQRNRRVKGIRLARNSGQHRAISAGLDFASGDYVILIDCDLQDSIESIPQLLDKSKSGFDVVFARKVIREYSFFRNSFARLYFKIFNFLTEGEKVDSRVGTFSILNKKAVSLFRRFKDTHRHYVLVVKLIGLKVTYVDVPHYPRHSGKSSYSFKKLIVHAIEGVLSQSTKLLKSMSLIGFVVLFFSFLFGVYLIFNYLISGTVPSGYTSVALLVVFSMSVNLIFLGVFGLYLGMVFEQVKSRPLYLVDEMLNFNLERMDV